MLKRPSVTLPAPEPGLVIAYAYLWHSEYQRGREEGRKDRPCAIVLTAPEADGQTVVIVVPITHTPPERADEAVEIPLATQRRLGLDAARSWAIVSEVNRFTWPGPDIRPVSRNEPERFDYGFVPPSLFRQIRDKLASCAVDQRLRSVPRTE
jgi:mRNA-degrading endonuclease toxin of MazEF toxin-antitoxin module